MNESTTPRPHGDSAAPPIVTENNSMVLLIDDQPLVAESLRRILVAEDDIDLHYCQDPGAAMASAEQVKPSVILLDLLMPDIDGLTLLRYLRANPTTKFIPVVVLSSKEEPEAKAEAFGQGANDYLIKWPNPVELTARIRYHSQWYRNLLERDDAFRALRVSQRKLTESNVELQRLASLDGLTGVANRRYLDKIRMIEWRRAAREQDWLTLMMIDIDYFKSYNDCHGHQAGDEALRQVARVISSVLKRPADTVGRYGGEEFEVIMPGTSPEGAKAVAQRIQDRLDEERIEHKGSPVSANLTISLGLATTVPTPGADPDSLIAQADRALYLAKEQGRDRFVAAPTAKS